MQRQEVEEGLLQEFEAQEEEQWRTECQQSGWTTLDLVPLGRLCSTTVRPVAWDCTPKEKKMKKRRMKKKREEVWGEGSGRVGQQEGLLQSCRSSGTRDSA